MWTSCSFVGTSTNPLITSLLAVRRALPACWVAATEHHLYTSPSRHAQYCIKMAANLQYLETAQKQINTATPFQESLPARCALQVW